MPTNTYTHTAFYTSMKKNEDLSFACNWMKWQNRVLNEIFQPLIIRVIFFSYMWGKKGKGDFHENRRETIRKENGNLDEEKTREKGGTRQ